MNDLGPTLVDDEEDQGQPWAIVHGAEIAAEAESAYLSSQEDGLQSSIAEFRSREALRLAASAFNWLEDSELEPYAHIRLDELGRRVRRRFPETCELTWTGQRYEHRCPVRIAHKRIGASPGFVVTKKVCVLCGSDPSECEHMPNRKYRVRGGAGPAGYCVVCGKESCDEHSSNLEYTVRPIVVIVEARLIEISLVSRPRQPDARLTALPVDIEDLRHSLGPTFRPGMRVACSMCLEPCGGLEYLTDDPRANKASPNSKS